MKQKTQNKINKQHWRLFTTIWSNKLKKHVILAGKESKSTMKAGISAKPNLMLNVTRVGGGLGQFEQLHLEHVNKVRH